MDAVTKANTMYNYHSVYWDVIDLIIKDIRLHKYKPGDRLPTELELMEQTGLSRSSVREAIKVLSAMGVVRIQRGSGTFISDASSVVGLESITYSLLMDSTPKKQALEFRKCIESMLYSATAEKITEEEILQLEKNISDSYEAYNRRDIPKLIELDQAFHMMIISFSRNLYLEKLLRGVYEFFTEEFLSKNAYTLEEFNSSMKSHKDTVRYFRTKNPADLNDSMSSMGIFEMY